MSDEIRDYDVVAAMERYGGSFVRALAGAFTAADSDNFAKLKEAFPFYWRQYTEIARDHKQIRG